MSLFVSIEDKDGEVIGRVYDINHLPGRFAGIKKGLCLRFLSEKEDAAFNQAQLPFLLEELKELQKENLSETEAEELSQVIKSAETIKGKPRHVIKFYGEERAETE